MEKVVDRVCGLDVHRDTVEACVRLPGPGATRQEIIETFGTMTPDLLALRDWLKTHGVTHVAMESTGVFWKPVYYLLEEDFTVLLVNAAHIKNVPGRKTDAKDGAWIAQLLEHGLLKGFHPASADPGPAGPDAASEGADPGARPGGPATAQGALGRRDQAVVRRD